MDSSILAKMPMSDSGAAGNPPASNSDKTSAPTSCRPCFVHLLKSILMATVVYYVLLSLYGVMDNWAARQAVSDYKPSARFEEQLTKLGVKFESNVYQPLIAYTGLSLLPNDISCGYKHESAFRSMMCPLLKLVPYPTGVAIAVVDLRGNRTIRMNQLGEWSTVLAPLEKTPIPMKQVIDWTLWHELGHIHQMTKDGATQAWFDPGQTHLYPLYKETHSDIFALMNLAQEPDMRREDLQKLLTAVITVRQHYAKSDLLHSSDEYLRCIKFEELFVPGDVAPVALKLFETALQRKAAGQCFNAPPTPAAKIKS